MTPRGLTSKAQRMLEAPWTQAFLKHLHAL